MAKKYVPSGYQIINLDITATAFDGTPFTISAETEDEITLCDILDDNKQYEKPILLKIHEKSQDYNLCGFVTCVDGTLILGDPTGTETSIKIENGEDYHELSISFVGA